MYKLLIAEDEIWISALIRNIVSKGCPDIEIAGEAANGRKALEQILELQPDIVLADINMPVLSGLQMIAEAQKAGFTGKFVIISGYKDFSYVQQALRSGVEDYLLKPINDAKLCSVIARVAQKIKSGREASLQSARSETLLKIQFLNKLLLGGNISLEEGNTLYGLNFAPGYFRCVALRLSSHSPEQSCLLQDGIPEIFSLAQELLGRSLASLCKEAFFTLNGACLILFLNYDRESSAPVGQGLRNLFSDLQAMPLTRQFRLHMGVSRETDRFDRVLEACRQAQCAASSVGKVVYYEELHRQDQDVPPPLVIEDADRIQLNRALHTASAEALTAWAHIRFDDYVERHGVIDTETFSVLNVVTLLLGTALDAIQALPLKLAWDRQELFNRLETCLTVRDLRERMGELLREIKGQLDQQLNAEDVIIHRVTEYINAHLDGSITLEEAAAVVHLSPSYLSEYFKTKTGFNFKDYVLERRLKRAMELLKKGQLPIKEIAAHCGYNDFKHFTKVFKKTLGITPTEFRRIYG